MWKNYRNSELGIMLDVLSDYELLCKELEVEPTFEGFQSSLKREVEQRVHLVKDVADMILGEGK